MTEKNHVIRSATAEDLSAITELLQECELPTSDLTENNLALFLVAETADKRIVGVAGLDRIGSTGLLRSVAVSRNWRRSGLGQRLVAQCETAALIAGVYDVFLMTVTAIDFFRRMEYLALSRGAVPAKIAEHSQFRSLYPSSAQCLGKRL